MTGPWPSASAPRTTASTPVFLATFALVFVTIAAIGAIDLWLARIDRRESTLHAAHLFEDGEALLAAGKPRDAADRFASAQALERSNVRYSVALAQALLADGRASDAESELRAALTRSESDGEANLAMARTLARQGRTDEASSFYHRAIYGRWDSDPGAHQLAVRLELIDLLSRKGMQRELLAELLPLQDVAPDSVTLRRRLAHLFLAAGSPERATAIFRDLLRHDPRDGDAYAGMGQAALLLGNFRTARADLLQATGILPDSALAATQLLVADSALALDPAARGIDAGARLGRSRAFLQRTLDVTAPCLPAGAARQLADSGRRLLSQPVSSRRAADESESDALIDLATEIWSRREPSCRLDTGPGSQALALLQERLQR